MCEHQPRNKEQLKQKIEENQRELEQAVKDGDDTLCEMIQRFLNRHLKGLNIVPSDGSNNH